MGVVKSVQSIAETAFFTSLKEARDFAGGWKGILLDWDGCLAISNRLHPDAVEFLKEFQDRVAIVSNNSTDLPADFAAIMGRHGIHIPAERIVLAGVEAIRCAARAGKRPTMILANRKMVSHARSEGVLVSRAAPELVILLRDTQFTFRRFAHAANALQAGADLIVSNTDRNHPGENGGVVPETGALLAALLESTSYDARRIQVIGKPSASLFLAGCRALGVTAQEAVMIGDNPLTDIAGASAIGISSILVQPAASRTVGA